MIDEKTCEWHEEGDPWSEGTYETSCGAMWSFTDGGIKENEVIYCHKCGGKIIEIPFESAEDDEGENDDAWIKRAEQARAEGYASDDEVNWLMLSGGGHKREGE